MGASCRRRSGGEATRVAPKWRSNATRSAASASGILGWPAEIGEAYTMSDDTAGHDAGEMLEIRRYVERQSVEADRPAHADTDGRNLVLAPP